MNKLIHALIALTILIGTPAMADSKAEALEVIHQWINAVNRNDIDGVVATFATDASFFGTTTKTVVHSSDGIREYFKTVYAKFAPLSVGLGQFTVSELSADSAVFTGYDKWQVTVSDKPVEGVGRLSIAVARRAGQWRIVSFHRSAMPN
jgi:uncharacterized protein (TIGR02246 family)